MLRAPSLNRAALPATRLRLPPSATLGLTALFAVGGCAEKREQVPSAGEQDVSPGPADVGRDAAEAAVEDTRRPAQTVTVTVEGSGHVSSDPAGIDCGEACTAAFPSGTRVVLTPSPGPGFVFDGWRGSCEGPGTCTVVTDAPHVVVADFVPEQGTHALHVRVFGEGTVSTDPPRIDCPETCAASFAEGSSVALTATPSAGHVLGGWAASCDGTDGLVCNLTMTEDRQATASFSPGAQLGSLSVHVVGEGRVRSEPPGLDCPGACSRDLPAGARITLIADPARGYRFGTWSGACEGRGPCTVLLREHHDVTATFEPADLVVGDSFIPSFAIKYGDAGAGARDLDETARFDVLLVTSVHHHVWGEGGQTSWETLATRHADQVVLLRALGPGLYNTAAWGVIGSGWEWLKANHGVDAGEERWTGTGARFEYLASGAFPAERSMLLANEGWQQWWLDNVHRDWWLGGRGVHQTGASGVFAGRTGYRVPFADGWFDEAHTGDDAFADHPADYRLHGAYQHDAWRSDTNAFIGRAVPWLAERDLLLAVELGRMEEDPEAWRELDALPAAPFAAFEEAGFIGRQGGTYTVSGWEQKVETLLALDNVAALVACHGDVPGAAGLAALDVARDDGNTGPTTGWEALWFCMTSLLCALEPGRPNAYLGFTAWGYTGYHWLDELDPEHLHLGAPLGDYGAVGGVYLREFEDGWVAVNPSPEPANGVAVPAGQARVLDHARFADPDASALVETFDLPAWRGIVLLKEGRLVGDADNR